MSCDCKDCVRPAINWNSVVREGRGAKFEILGMWSEEGRQGEIQALLAKVYVVEARYCVMRDATEFKAYAPFFDRIDPRHQLPEARILRVPDGLSGWRLEFEACL